MALEAGETVYSGDVQEHRDDSNVSAGAAVTIDGNGDLADVDTDANELIGACTESGNLLLEGTVVAAASGVSEGDRVDGGNATNSTTGQFETSSGGPGVALSGVGGTWNGSSVPSGHAVIHF